MLSTIKPGARPQALCHCGLHLSGLYDTAGLSYKRIKTIVVGHPHLNTSFFQQL